MPGTSYNVDKGFINNLNISSMHVAIELLYSLNIEEMLYLAKKGVILSEKSELITEFSLEDAKKIGKMILLTKLTYFEINFLTLNESLFLVKIVFFCLEENKIQDILIKHKNRNSIFYNWFLHLVIKSNLYKKK